MLMSTRILIEQCSEIRLCFNLINTSGYKLR